MENDSRYDPQYVCSLFDEMAATYGIVNLCSSFGFTYWWRRKCGRSIEIQPNSVVVDLMTGMAELCTVITKSLDSESELIALDISAVMCDRARQHRFSHKFQVVEADALACPLDDSSVDYVFSSFGLKTFNEKQLAVLASEVRRILRPGGRFAFLEISVPSNSLLRIPYMFYLERVVPVLGRMFLGNPENYRMLGVYTSAFGNCRLAGKLFEQNGMSVKFESYFFGCATGIIGEKS